MRNEAYNMDCIEYMRSLPDNAFDIAVCDPPYGKGNDDNLVGGGKKSRPAHIETLRGMVQTLRQADGTDCLEDGEKDTTSRWNRLLGGRRERYYKPADTSVQWRDVGREIQNRGGAESRSSTMGCRSSAGVLR